MRGLLSASLQPAWCPMASWGGVGGCIHSKHDARALPCGFHRLRGRWAVHKTNMVLQDGCMLAVE